MGSQKPYLGEFEELVLLAIIALEDNAYGVSIRRLLEERTGRNISFGAIYTTLERLKKKGYISPRRGEPTNERGGRAKLYFDVEGLGELVLNETQKARNRMLELVELKPAWQM